MRFAILVIVMIVYIGLNAQSLFLKIGNPQVNGNKVTYDLSVANFTDIFSMEYLIHYDPDLLTFSKIKNITMPFLFYPENFYTGISGAIQIAWTDLLAQGQTIPDSTIIYQIEFQMKNGTYGSVCFSENPDDNEYSQNEYPLSSIFVVDDCHPEPFEIVLTTSVGNVMTSNPELKVQNVAQAEQISFSLTEHQSLAFQVFDLSGMQVASFPQSEYTAGENVLDLKMSKLVGIYILTTEIGHQPFSFKIILQ